MMQTLAIGLCVTPSRLPAAPASRPAHGRFRRPGPTRPAGRCVCFHGQSSPIGPAAKGEATRPPSHAANAALTPSNRTASVVSVPEQDCGLQRVRSSFATGPRSVVRRCMCQQRLDQASGVFERHRLTGSDMFEQSGDLPVCGLRVAMQLEHIAQAARVRGNGVQCHGTWIRSKGAKRDFPWHLSMAIAER